MKGLIIIMCLLLSRNAVFSLDERKNLAIHVFPFAKCEKDSVEAICASWLEPSINVRGGYFYVPLIHSCFFLGGGGGGRISHCLNFDTFCDKAPLYFTSV